MLWSSKRRSSRSNDIIKGSSSLPTGRTQSTTPSPSSSSHRLPFAPIDLQTSHTFPDGDQIAPFLESSDHDSKYLVGRPIISSRELSDHKYPRKASQRKLAPPPTMHVNRRPSLSAVTQMSDVPPLPKGSQNEDELYTVNTLSKFSFGLPTSSSSSPAISPLDDDNQQVSVDRTPRASVTGYAENGDSVTGNTQSHQRSHRSHRSHIISGHDPYPGTADTNAHIGTSTNTNTMKRPYETSRVYSNNSSRDRDPSRNRNSDTASHHTFGTSSASASVTSLSSLGRTDGERLREHTPSTSTTPSAANTDDEGLNHTMEFSSEEDFEDGDDDYDYYDDEVDPEEYRIEISSAVYGGGSSEGAYSVWGGPGSHGSASAFGDSYHGERRGSLPMAIPASSSSEAHGGREREDSLATLRRPSRSLDDDLTNPMMENPAEIAGPRAPTTISVPQSDGDWKSLYAKRQRERESVSTLSTIKGHSSTTPTTATAPIITEPGADSTSAMGFDLDWSNIRGGITSFDQIDFIAPLTSPNSAPRRPSAISVGKLSIFGGGRRPSAASFMNYDDTFVRAVGKWDKEGYGQQREDWAFRREKADSSGPSAASGKNSGAGARIAMLLGGTPRDDRDRVGLSSIGSGTSRQVSVNGATAAEDREKREREREKERRMPGNWKGMSIGAGEVWRNDMIGRFEVLRSMTHPTDASSNKGPQQRLSINHFRDATSLPKGPPVSIHKHSKAIAFSISRFYKQRPPDSSPTTEGRVSNVSRVPLRSPGPGKIKNPTMILLAPRRVQVAFTSTMTTRKLESHGHLDDHGRGARDKNTSRKEGKEKMKRVEEERIKSRGKNKESALTLPSSSAASLPSASRRHREVDQTTSVGSVVSKPSSSRPSSSSGASITPSHRTGPAAGSSLDTYSQLDYSDTTFSSRPHRRHMRDSLDLSDDDDEDSLPRQTPHSETYSTVDASLIHQLRTPNDRSYRPAYVSDLDAKSGLFRRVLGARSTSSAPHHGGHVQYAPPWITLDPRNKQEEKEQVVALLNTSFVDVGLLPSSTHSKRRSASIKTKKSSPGTNTAVDVFDEVPPDILFMLLPLWPGDTDLISKRKYPQHERPRINQVDRQYLLVSYKPIESASQNTHVRTTSAKSKQGGDSKKSSRSPTSSVESSRRHGGGSGGGGDEHSILLSSFHIVARHISYHDVQGSGMRAPAEGMCVTGPLDEAYHTMPRPVNPDEAGMSWIIGSCASRESGVVFDPEGLVKLGLCQFVEPNDAAVPVFGNGLTIDQGGFEEPEPQPVLTPIGRGVLEMAWVGGMALLSFGSIVS